MHYDLYPKGMEWNECGIGWREKIMLTFLKMHFGLLLHSEFVNDSRLHSISLLVETLLLMKVPVRRTASYSTSALTIPMVSFSRHDQADTRTLVYIYHK